MSYPRDLDDYTQSELEAELSRRQRLCDARRCDYCGQPYGAPKCRYPSRHQPRPDWTVKWVSYSSDEGYEGHDSEAEASAAAERVLAWAEEEASGGYGWPDVVQSIWWGRVEVRGEIVEEMHTDEDGREYATYHLRERTGGAQ